MPKKLLSESLVIEASKRKEKIIFVDEGCLVTDAARDRAGQLGIAIEKRKQSGISNVASVSPPRAGGAGKETIAIASDHGGFMLKELLRPHIISRGYNVVDLGTNSEEPCDYPDYALSVALTVIKNAVSRGIMIDTLGAASAMVANKIPGIRAVNCFDEFSARSSREHNNSNILTLGGKTVGLELAKSIVTVWLETPYGGGRHQKRLDKVSEIEKRFLRS